MKPMKSTSFTLMPEDLKKLDFIKKRIGIPSRSETVRRIIEKELERG